jgi:hypothetical protein
VIEGFSLNVADHRLEALWRHWLDARGGRAMPGRLAIDPAKIAPALPYIYVYDFNRDSGRFYNRLAGEHIYNTSGVRGGNRYLDDLFTLPVAQTIRGWFMRVVGVPSIAHMGMAVRYAGGEEVRGERLILPLSADGDVADGLIGASVYRHEFGLTAGAWVDVSKVEAEYLSLPPQGWRQN